MGTFFFLKGGISCKTMAPVGFPLNEIWKKGSTLDCDSACVCSIEGWDRTGRLGLHVIFKIERFRNFTSSEFAVQVLACRDRLGSWLNVRPHLHRHTLGSIFDLVKGQRGEKGNRGVEGNEQRKIYFVWTSPCKIPQEIR